jgi:acetoin utilization deacetylase AcuC-like enzyme
MTFGLISHPDCLKHQVPEGHPENAQRINAIQDKLIAVGMDMVMPYDDAPPATVDQLKYVHDEAYIDRLFKLANDEQSVWLDQDTWFGPGTLTAALHAAGSGILAIDKVMAMPAIHQFALVRPPGHHAGPDRASGFCIFNNIAIAARYALDKYALDRVAIIDFDAHHGNGTEEIFSDDDRVLFCSLFQHPFYPEYPFARESSRILNAPVAAYSDGSVMREIFEKEWLPALDEFRPELILVSAGFDAHRDDDMANLALTDDDYHWMSRQILKLANKYASGRLVAMLEGGYEKHALVASTIAFLKAGLDQDI